MDIKSNHILNSYNLKLKKCPSKCYVKNEMPAIVVEEVYKCFFKENCASLPDDHWHSYITVSQTKTYRK